MDLNRKVAAIMATPEVQQQFAKLMVSVIGCGLGGAFYGVMTAPGTLSAILFGIACGSLGVLIGAPVGFCINMTRYLHR